jgi:hypothetical protein
VSRLERLPAAAGINTNSRIGVIGSVAMWGRVVEHAAGYRGQLGYPDRLRLVCRFCLSIGRAGVPTRIERAYGGEVEPVCDAHSEPDHSFGREIEPEQLQQMMLSAYAVDLLPVEALYRAGFRPGPIPPAGLLPAARAELRRLGRGWSTVVAVASLVAVFMLVRALGLFPSTDAREVPDREATATPIGVETPIADALHAGPSLELVHPVRDRRERVFRFGIVCGNRIGGRAEIVGCGRPAELLGFDASPPEAKRECTAGNAYSRRPGFSVCWLDLSIPIGPGLEILRLPRVRRWDLT